MASLFGIEKSVGNIGQRAPSGGSDEWITPKWIIDALGPFDLDPCAAQTMPWQTASACFTELDNGLRKEWRGFVWMNPPYGTAARTWLARLAGHGNGIALVFARTETGSFFSSVWPKASALLFLSGRLHFCRRDGTVPTSRGKSGSGGPSGASVLIAYGDTARDRLNRIASRGALVTEWRCPDTLA